MYRREVPHGSSSAESKAGPEESAEWEEQDPGYQQKPVTKKRKLLVWMVSPQIWIP